MCARVSLLDFSQHQISIQSPKTAAGLKLGRERDVAASRASTSRKFHAPWFAIVRVCRSVRSRIEVWVILVRGNSGGREDIFAKMLKRIWPARY